MSFGIVAASYGSNGEELIQPLAAWNFENEVNDMCADVTGNGHVLTRGTYGAWVTGHNSAVAIQGDPANNQAELGAGVYGTFPGGSPGSDPFSICFWAQLPDANGGPCISAYNTVAGRSDPWNISVESDGSVQAWWYSDADVLNGAPVSMTTGAVAANTWVHIAGVFVPGSGVTLYVGGVIVTTYGWQGGSSAFYGTWETLLVGSSRWGSAGVTIDDLRIYHEVLTDTQITTLMNQPL